MNNYPVSLSEKTVEQLKSLAAQDIWEAVDALKEAVKKYDCMDDGYWAKDLSNVIHQVSSLGDIAMAISDCGFEHHETEIENKTDGAVVSKEEAIKHLNALDEIYYMCDRIHSKYYSDAIAGRCDCNQAICNGCPFFIENDSRYHGDCILENLPLSWARYRSKAREKLGESK